MRFRLENYVAEIKLQTGRAKTGIIGSTRAAVISILEPVLMVLIAVALLGERLDAVQWFGVAMVFGALWALEALPALEARKAIPEAQK